MVVEVCRKIYVLFNDKNKEFVGAFLSHNKLISRIKDMFKNYQGYYEFDDCYMLDDNDTYIDVYDENMNVIAQFYYIIEYDIDEILINGD